jgi:hypothetical protein
MVIPDLPPDHYGPWSLLNQGDDYIKSLEWVKSILGNMSQEIKNNHRVFLFNYDLPCDRESGKSRLQRLGSAVWNQTTSFITSDHGV